MKMTLIVFACLAVFLLAQPALAFQKTFYPTSFAPSVVVPSGSIFPRLSTHRNLTEARSTLNNEFFTYNISPGEFDSTLPGNTDAGQWQPNETIGSTTASKELINPATGDFTNESMGAGWLYNNSLHNVKMPAGSWTFKINVSWTQGAVGDTNRWLSRITIRNTTGAFIKNLTADGVVSETLTTQQAGWRSQEEGAIAQCAAPCTKNYTFTIATAKNYTFQKFDILFIEMGFGNANDATDRTAALITNQTRTNITTPEIDYIPQLRANHTSDSPNVTITAGKSTLFRGNCEAFNSTLTVDRLNITVSNSTINTSSTFTNITTVNTEPIYANVTTYAPDPLSGSNSTTFFFNITANTAGTYYLQIVCETGAKPGLELEPTGGSQPTESNSSSSPARPGTTFILTVEAAPDTCSPAGAGEAYEFACSDNCLVAGKDWYFSSVQFRGSGTITVRNSNLTASSLLYVDNTCTLFVDSVYPVGGGVNFGLRT
jgi:hypothetical protein